MEIGKGKFWVYGKRGQVVQLPLKVTHKYEQPGCHVCLDYVANLGDISTGSVGSPDGWSTVFVRSKIGDSVWAKAMAAGVFETQPIEKVKPGLELVTKLANEKITKNKATSRPARPSVSARLSEAPTSNLLFFSYQIPDVAEFPCCLTEQTIPVVSEKRGNVGMTPSLYIPE